jgi:hypothetical protein
MRIFGRCYGMEMNVEKKVMIISRQPSPITIYDRPNQLENVECFQYLGSMLTKDGRRNCEIKSRIAMEKTVLNKKKNFSSSHLSPMCWCTLDLNARKKLVNFYI